jgi:hypothetical protein
MERKSVIRITVENEMDPIVAFMIDCGNAMATIRAIELIQEYCYGKKSLQIQAILSTQKHQDHTAGDNHSSNGK